MVPAHFSETSLLKWSITHLVNNLNYFCVKKYILVPFNTEELRGMAFFNQVIAWV